MLSYYRRTKLSSRLLALGLIEALVFAIVLRNYPITTLLPALGISAGSLFVLDAILRRGSLVLATIVALGQIVVGTYGAVSIDGAAASIAGSTNQNDFIFYFLQAFVLFAISLHAVWAIYFARGRVWFNLLIASALLNFGVVTFVGFGILPILFAVPTALGISLIYLALRTIRYRKRVPFTAPARSKATLSALQSDLQERGFNVVEGVAGADYLAVNSQVILSVSAIEAKSNIKITAEGLIADGEDITEVLAQSATAARRSARSLRFPRHSVYAVVYTRKAGLNPPLRAIKVRSRKSPDRVLGTVYLANPKGLQRLLKGTSAFKSLSARKVARLAKIGA